MSKEDRDKFERHFDEVAAMVPDDDEVAVLTRAEMFGAMALAWSCGQSQLAYGLLENTDTVAPMLPVAAADAVMHPDIVLRVGRACADGASAYGAVVKIVAAGGGEEDE